jgi:hypothetical protein
MPKIVDAGAIGEGVRITVAYSKGDNMGELLGEIVPYETNPDNGWAAEIYRDDFGGSKPMCKVNTRYMGN